MTVNRLIDVFHDTCMGCHEQRAADGLKAGPVTCGECHQRRAPGESERAAMAFDYSLHARHVRTYPEKCDNCHHVYDEVEKKLRYEKGKEEACRACHGAVDVEKNLSLANASHRRCIACHLDRARQQLDGGPVECVGCHDAAKVGEIKQLEEIPRLVRGQPDSLWVKAPGATSAMVTFNHLFPRATAGVLHDVSPRPAPFLFRVPRFDGGLRWRRRDNGACPPHGVIRIQLCRLPPSRHVESRLCRLPPGGESRR